MGDEPGLGAADTALPGAGVTWFPHPARPDATTVLPNVSVVGSVQVNDAVTVEFTTMGLLVLSTGVVIVGSVVSTPKLTVLNAAQFWVGTVELVNTSSSCWSQAVEK